MTNQPLLPGLPQPIPEPDGLDAPYWEALARHQLLIQRCEKCATFQMPAEWICHRCHSSELTWIEVPPRGRIFSWMRVHHPAHPALKDRVPYLVVLVELPNAGNVRLLGNLLGPQDQSVTIGGKVEGEFEDHPEGFTLLQWRLR